MNLNEFKCKLIDFESSSDEESKIDIDTGTERYLPPEAHTKKPYNGVKADLFALGVSLFVMVA